MDPISVRNHITLEDIQSVNYRYRLDETWLYPLLDRLLLFIQKPVLLAIFCKIDSKFPLLIFCNIDETDTRDIAINAARIAMKDGEHCFSIHSADNAVEIVFVIMSWDITDTRRLGLFGIEGDIFSQFRQLIESLEDETGQSLSQNIVKAAKAPIEGYLRPRLHSRRPSMVTEEYARNICSKISADLDNIYQSIAHEQLGNKVSPDFRAIPNLFCVIRYRGQNSRNTPEIPYTAQLLLSKIQSEIINANNILPKTSLPRSEILQEPLRGAKEHTIADSLFASGTLEFSPDSYGIGRDSDEGGNSGTGKERRVLEAELYKNFGKGLMYVPVHVGGVPWATLFTLSGPTANSETVQLEEKLAQDNWLHFHRFYTTCVPHLAERIRIVVQQRYVEEVSSCIRNGLLEYFAKGSNVQKGSDLIAAIDGINSDLLSLTGFFPFGEITLHTSSANNVPGRVEVGRVPSLNKQETVYASIASTNPNACFAPWIKYGQLRADDIQLIAAIKMAVNEAILQDARINSALSQFTKGWAHDVKNTSGAMSNALAALRASELSLTPLTNKAIVFCRVTAFNLNASALAINELQRSQKKGLKRWQDFLALTGQESINDSFTSLYDYLLQARVLLNAYDKRRFKSIFLEKDEYDGEFGQLGLDCFNKRQNSRFHNITGDTANPQEHFTKVGSSLGVKDEANIHADSRFGICVSILNEVVSNIRINHPLPPEELQSVFISRSVDWNDDGPVLKIRQFHLEDEKEFDPSEMAWLNRGELPNGLQNTLGLFGPDNLGICVININNRPDNTPSISNVEIDGYKAVAINFEVELQFPLAEYSER